MQTQPHSQSAALSEQGHRTGLGTLPEGRRRALTAAAVIALLLVMVGQMALSIRGESQTWDEGDHIYAGYRSWTHKDFGLNPEHPPLVKLIAALPLLGMELKTPPLQSRYFKNEAFAGGKDFVFRNNADAILFRARMAAATLTVLLALLVFFAAREMFGTVAGLLALAIVAFDPNLLAHGAFVTTDAGLSCFLFATVYAFYRYVRKPTAVRMVVMGLAGGGALAVKHSGVLAFALLALLALSETAVYAYRQGLSARAAFETARHAARLTVAIFVAGLISVAVLWSVYGFRYRARPEGLEMNPPLARYTEQLRPREAEVIRTLARFRALPESYLYGLTDVRRVSDEYPGYIFGKVYRRGVWFYFPSAFVIKSTAAFLALLLLSLVAVAAGWIRGTRELLFLLAPPVFHLLVAMTAGLNIGVRHILPMYVFLAVLLAGCAAAIIRRGKSWAAVVMVMLALHAVSTARCFPTYLAYANEFWGGPANTYRYLTDSNTDWAQQLKGVKKYLDDRGVKSCWFAYFAEGVADPKYYGIPCKPLPTISSIWLGEQTDVPPSIDGPVLISLSTLSGYETGSGALNPYDSFQRLHPTDVIEYGVAVYDGHFSVPLASAWPRVRKSGELLGAGQKEAALDEAQAAVDVCPDCVQAQAQLGRVLRSLKRPEEARAAFTRALALAEGLEVEFQPAWVPRLRKALEAR